MDDLEKPRAPVPEAASPALRPRKAAALVEYALILSLISVLAVGSLVLVGGSVNGVFGSVAAALGPGPHDNGCHGQAGCHENNGGGNGNPGGGNPGSGNQGGSQGGSNGGNGSGK